MAAKDRDDDRSFLARWSQRKQEAAEEAVEPKAIAPQAAPTPAAEEAVDVSALPDIDSLDAGADFTAFMRKGVPEALKRRALRRLWQVDPAFHEICMLDDYNLDYTDAAMVVPNLKTVYQVGRGMVPPEPAPEETGGGDDAAAPRPATGESAQASLPAPDPAYDAGPDSDVAAKQAKDEEPPVIEAPAARHAAAPESARAARNRQPAASAPAAPDAARSARRRRWGDTDA